MLHRLLRCTFRTKLQSLKVTSRKHRSVTGSANPQQLAVLNCLGHGQYSLDERAGHMGMGDKSAARNRQTPVTVCAGT